MKKDCWLKKTIKTKNPSTGIFFPKKYNNIGRQPSKAKTSPPCKAIIADTDIRINYLPPEPKYHRINYKNQPEPLSFSKEGSEIFNNDDECINETYRETCQ